MIRIIQLVFLALLIFFAVTEGIPWVREQVEGITPDKFSGRDLPDDDGEEAACVQLAHQAGAYLNQQAVAASQPPGNPEIWTESMVDVQERIYEAERACSCALDACNTARDALVEISRLASDVDRLIGGDASTAGELARRQEGINALLEQARVLAR